MIFFFFSFEFCYIQKQNINFYKKQNRMMKQKRKQWTFEEISILKDVQDIEKPKKWKYISQCLSRKGWNRSHVECRNMWVNSLAPQINHKAWSDDQLQHLYALYQKHNSRWSSIQKQLPNRTQIRIKNHFYGVLRGITRFVLKYFKEAPRNQTKISNRVNPNYLKNMYKGIKEFSFLGNAIPTVVAMMGYKFNKHKFTSFLENNKANFQKLSKCIFEIGRKPDEFFLQSRLQAERSFSLILEAQISNQAEAEQASQKSERQQIQMKRLVDKVPYFSVPMVYYTTSELENTSLFPRAAQMAIIPIMCSPPLVYQFSQNMDCWVSNTLF